MVEEKKKKEEEKKVSIYERGGEFDDNLTILEIEKTLHPRSKEVIKEELETILKAFVEQNVDKTGTIKDPNKAADAFLELLAKYHFGEAYETVKEDKRHVTQTLRDKYGVSRTALKKAFGRKGAYKTIDTFYAAHRDPLVDRADEVKKQHAQESLGNYLSDENARKEIPEHLKTRIGKELSDSYKAVVDLETTVNLIGQYMALPGAVEEIEKDKKATLNLPDAQAGHPSIHQAFKEGDKYHQAYTEEAKKVDDTHKLKTKKDKPTH